MGDKSPKAIKKKNEQKSSKAVQVKKRNQQFASPGIAFAGKKAKR